jgi:hypothetical protein
MSATGESILEQIKKLPPADQRELLEQLLSLAPPVSSKRQKPLPRVKVSGGAITSEQVAETLEDE